MGIKAHYLQDKDGNKMYPYGHVDAIFDRNGNKLGTVIDELDSSVSQSLSEAKSYTDGEISELSSNIAFIDVADNETVVDAVVEEMANHSHSNLGVLNKLSESDGVLLYDGSAIQGGGISRADGKSAYQIAVDHGFEGTEEEWLESLKGANGEDGQDGQDGLTPTIGENGNWFIGDVDTGVTAEGKNGADGKDGVDGADGKSAYQIACDKGFEGDEAAWLESLKGEPGEQGEKGEDGTDGRSIKAIVTDNNNNVIVTFSDGVTENIGSIAFDVQADFLTSGGFGKLRYYNRVFQSYDESTSTWVDIQPTDDNTLILNLAPQPMQKMFLTFDVNAGAYKITFKEPKDTIVDGQMLVCVEGIKFVRKLGSEPTSVDDGTLVLDYKRRQFASYNHTSYLDESFTPEFAETWYYKAFPYSTNGYVGESSANVASCTSKDYWLFGFKLDQNESDPGSMITYLEDCDNAYYESAYMDYNKDSFNYGDWEEAWFIRDLKPVMLKYDGNVDYELLKSDYTLRADGITASDVANTLYEGNVMMGIPKVYWKIVDIGDDTANIYFSTKKLDEDFHCWSHIDNNGNEIDYCYMPIYGGSLISNKLRSISGLSLLNTIDVKQEITYAKANNQTSDVIWYTEVYSDRMLINLLLMLIGKSTDTQTVFGNGCCVNNSETDDFGKITGLMDDKGLFYGSNGTDKAVKVFGMENWWGNQWRRIAGWINNKGTQMIKLTYGQSDGSTIDGYNTDGSGYITMEHTLAEVSGTYISKMATTRYGLFPTIASGSATTHYTDGLWVRGESDMVRYILTGGAYNDFRVGALCCNLGQPITAASKDIGASISCKPLATT